MPNEEMMEPAAPTSTEPLESAESDDSVNWSSMSSELDADADGLTIEGDSVVLNDGAAPEGFSSTPPAVEPVVKEPEAPVVTPAEKPAEPAAQPAPAKQDEQPAQPAAPQQPAQPFDYKQWEMEQLGRLEQLYQLSDEEQQAFLTEPEKTMPKLAATLHLKVTQAVLNSVQALVPNMIQQHQAVTQTETKAKNVFLEANPDLADPAYEKAILSVGTMYRSMNPNASREEAVKKIGELVRVSMGLPPLQAAGTQQTQPVEPAAAPRPFSPARGGAGGMPQPQQPDNVWASLALDDNE